MPVNYQRNGQYMAYEKAPNASQLALNRYSFLYKERFLPLLITICSYLDRFTIGFYKKGQQKNERYVTLPREDIIQFNKLLDEAAICFRQINHLTSDRSHAAKFLDDKLALLGNDDQFASLFKRKNQPAVIYITSCRAALYSSDLRG